MRPPPQPQVDVGLRGRLLPGDRETCPGQPGHRSLPMGAPELALPGIDGRRERRITRQERRFEGDDQHLGHPPERLDRRRLLQPFRVLPGERAADQRDGVEGEIGLRRDRIGGFLEAEVEQHRVEVMGLLHLGHRVTERDEVTVAAAEPPPGCEPGQQFPRVGGFRREEVELKPRALRCRRAP